MIHCPVCGQLVRLRNKGAQPEMHNLPGLPVLCVLGKPDWLRDAQPFRTHSTSP